MSTYELKDRLTAVLVPMVRAAGSAGVTANQVTVSAMALCLLFGAMASIDPSSALVWYAPFFILRTVMNNMDGAMARILGQKTLLGGYLNELGDVISDSAVYLPLALLPGVGMIAVGFVVVALVGEMAGVLGHAAGRGRCYLGPMGKTDRELLVGVVTWTVGMRLVGVEWIEGALWVGSVLGLVTVWRRVNWGVNLGV